MSNYLKKEIEIEFDQDRNYASILSKTKSIKQTPNLKLKYILAPTFIVLAILISFIGMNNKNISHEKLIIANDGKEIKVELNINHIKDMTVTSLDADAKAIEIESIPERFDFIHKILPQNLKLSQGYSIYTRSNLEVMTYDVLHDYVFSYTSEDLLKEITISLSELGQPLRDYFFEDTLKKSKINDVEVDISQYENMYIASFYHKNIYFDIETKGISQDDLINVLTSIIQ